MVFSAALYKENRVQMLRIYKLYSRDNKLRRIWALSKIATSFHRKNIILSLGTLIFTGEN